MKNIFSKKINIQVNPIIVIISIILLITLTTGIAVYATLNATEVKYSDEKTVAEALTELYDNTQDVSELNTLKSYINQTDASASDIVAGKKAYSGNELLVGTNNNNKQVILVQPNISSNTGAGTVNVDVKPVYSNYSQLTTNDFKLILTGMSWENQAYGSGAACTPSIVYNASTGICTVTPGYMEWSGKGCNAYNTVSLYIVK